MAETLAKKPNGIPLEQHFLQFHDDYEMPMDNPVVS